MTPVAKSRVREGCLLALVTLLALAVRLPHWRTIPPAGDEVGQAVYALKIAQGQGYPLVGNDAYAGPFFFYLLALLFRLGVMDPMVGRTVVLIAGTLTASATYAWVRQLRGSPVAGLVAGGLVAANPHLVLLNGHLGGTTFLVPFFTTLFLWLLARAITAERAGWWAASGLAAGLAIQANPIALLLVAGGWLWAGWRARRAPRPGHRWPLWLLVGGLCALLIYSPVVIYNLSSVLDSVSVAGERAYLWQDAPSLQTLLSNSLRLFTQIVRQTSGVLLGDETLRGLVGLPPVYLVWMVLGVAFTTRRVSALPLMVILPFLFTLPCLSSHYGMIYPVRFTTLMTPAFAASMGLVLDAALERVRIGGQPVNRWAPAALGVLAAALTTYPLVSLVQYYRYIEENHLSGHALLELSREMVAANLGEPIYIDSSPRMVRAKGIPYVPHAHLLFADIYQEFLPPEQIIGRLFERLGPATLLLSDEGAAAIEQVATLTPWASGADEEVRHSGYGLYTLDTRVPLVKPDFVLTGDRAEDVKPLVPVGTILGGGLELIGYDAPAAVAPGATVELTVYWRSLSEMEQATYIGFVHLLDPAMSLRAQEDHLLGQDRYPLGAWQPGEVVMDHYALGVPDDAAPGEYTLRAGVYTWPDLTRLAVADHPDDIVELESLDVVRQP